MLHTPNTMSVMKDEEKSESGLVSELHALRQYVSRLEGREAEYKRMEETLRESEKRYLYLYDNTPAMLNSIDPYGRIVSVSNRWLDTMGFERQEVVGRKFSDFFTEKSRQSADENGLPELCRTGFLKDVPCQLVKKDGEVIDVLLSATVEKDDARNVTGSLALLTDVTKLKRAEKEKRKLVAQLDHTKKMEAIGTLASGLAHDFNNLLMAIMGNISLAQMHTAPDDKIYRFLSEAEKASMHARELTAKFMLFSKGGELEKTITTISNLIKNATRLSLADSNIDCELSFPDDLWRVEIDVTQMSQVMSILIANAKEAQPEGGTIKIWAENMAVGKKTKGPGIPRDQGNYVKVSIQDMGVGIPKEHLPKIFDPYFSTKKDWTQKGMGLGLATAYAIILRHDGTIHVESEAGSGTTVLIYLRAVD